MCDKKIGSGEEGIFAAIGFSYHSKPEVLAAHGKPPFCTPRGEGQPDTDLHGGGTPSRSNLAFAGPVVQKPR